jgi:hypothetical protein
MFWFSVLWLHICYFSMDTELMDYLNPNHIKKKPDVLNPASSNALEDYSSFSYKIPQERCSSLMAYEVLMNAHHHHKDLTTIDALRLALYRFKPASQTTTGSDSSPSCPL